MLSYFVGPIARDRIILSARVTIQIEATMNTPVPTPSTISAVLAPHITCTSPKDTFVFRKYY